MKIATLNINGMSSTKLQMPTDFIGHQNVDMIFLQEVVTAEVGQIQGYKNYYNVRMTMQGTAIVVRNKYQNEKARGGHHFVGTFMEVVTYQHPSAPSCLSDICPFIHYICTPLPLERFPLKWILEFSFL